jgi:hypothetical protein
MVRRMEVAKPRQTFLSQPKGILGATSTLVCSSRALAKFTLPTLFRPPR